MTFLEILSFEFYCQVFTIFNHSHLLPPIFIYPEIIRCGSAALVCQHFRVTCDKKMIFNLVKLFQK